MRAAVATVVLCMLAFARLHSQSKDDFERVQYIPKVDRVSSDTLLGRALTGDDPLQVSFASLPVEITCGQRCMSRALLKLSYGIIGRIERYRFDRDDFDASISVIVEGRTRSVLKWTYPTQPSLAIEGTATSTKPVATIVLDVTEYSDLACSTVTATSNDIVITIDSIDTTGLTPEMVDSLVLTAELIQEYRILPYEGATLRCPSEIYVKSPSIADTVHPVRLSWQVADGATPCPDLYPSFEVEVLRLYNINPTYRDAETYPPEQLHVAC
ncbi:MAG: hypothetical protein FGM33_03835 [Candidatus Kapabacteria bacterium]|nr:hypothetical protein [Candidatus Kapabacteria bacterium]